MEAWCTGECTGAKATGWWQLAAYGSSSGLEESTQDGDLEERVERHVAVICARAEAGTVESRGETEGSRCGLGEEKGSIDAVMMRKVEPRKSPRSLQVAAFSRKHGS